MLQMMCKLEQRLAAMPNELSGNWVDEEKRLSARSHRASTLVRPSADSPSFRSH
jgi:hypothetical protein